MKLVGPGDGMSVTVGPSHIGGRVRLALRKMGGEPFIADLTRQDATSLAVALLQIAVPTLAPQLEAMARGLTNPRTRRVKL